MPVLFKDLEFFQTTYSRLVPSKEAALHSQAQAQTGISLWAVDLKGCGKSLCGWAFLWIWQKSRLNRFMNERLVLLENDGCKKFYPLAALKRWKLYDACLLQLVYIPKTFVVLWLIWTLFNVSLAWQQIAPGIGWLFFAVSPATTPPFSFSLLQFETKHLPFSKAGRWHIAPFWGASSHYRRK